MTTAPGDELAELLWDHGQALRRAPAPAPAPPPLFQPFTCSAAGSNRSQELKRHAADATPLGMHGAGAGLGLRGLPLHDDEEDDAVPWLHCPVVDDGDADTAPLPPEYCASLLSDYSEVAAAAVVPAAPPPEAAAANKLAPQSAAAGVGGGEGVVNFTFFSRPLQRPQAATAATASHPVESTVVQAATNRLRSTPLFSEQRMAWLQPPKPPRATAAAAATATPPPPPLPPPLAPLLQDNRHGETVAQLQSQPEAARPPDAAAVTTSSVCSGNGDRSRLKRSSGHLATDCSVSPDEDLDDEPGATRRSAARSAKRSRTAEVHNLSERRRRDRINEKMRALQELIPNCNKIDKASMLEEAIEYLKTLQLQVQMMSMGTGLCMPPAAMLLPAMHQHMQAAALHHHHPMAHFPHPHLGMGMGFGMGAAAAAVYDMLPRVAAGAHAHFPCTPMAMPPPGAMFGVPGQGIPSMPAAFAHMAGAGIGTAPAGQMEAPAAAAAAAVAPARPGEAEHPPVPGVAQGGQEAQQQHPKPT